jgi:hypothetical protein
MLTLPVEQWIGNVSGVWGAVSRRSEQSGYSRTAIYSHAQRWCVVIEQWPDLEHVVADGAYRPVGCAAILLHVCLG